MDKRLTEKLLHYWEGLKQGRLFPAEACNAHSARKG